MKYFNRSFAGTLAKLFFGRELEFILRTVTDDACRLCVQKCKDLSLIRADFNKKFFDVEYELSFAELKHISDAERKRQIDECDALLFKNNSARKIFVGAWQVYLLGSFFVV